jgi:hypothetical protein
MEDLIEAESNSNNGGATLTEQQKFILLLILGISGMVAVVVCLIALGMLVGFKLYRYFVHRLAMYQVMAALFFAIVCVFEMINIHLENFSCILSGFLMEYSIIVKLYFTLCLTFHLFFYSIFHINFKRLEVVHILVSVFVPLLFVWVPFVTDTYGQAGAWCWIMNWRNDTADHKLVAGEIEEYALLYGQSILGLILATISVIVILSVLIYRAYKPYYNPLLKNNVHKTVLKEVIPLVMYPVLSFALYIPLFINRFVGSLLNGVSFGVFSLSAVCTPSLSTFAGLTLIIHILVLKYSRISKRHVKPKPVYTSEGITNVFCSDRDGIPTTTAATEWEPPPESDVDKYYSSI